MSAGRALRHEARPVAEHVQQRVHRVLEAAPRRGRGAQAARRGRRQLPLGETVDLVVHHDVGEVHVAAHRVRHVPAADREAVAVAARDEHQQLGVRELDPLRDRQRPAVHAVEAVGGGVARDPARAADPGDERDLVRRAADGGERPVDRLDDAEVAAARAPDRLQVALVVLGLVRLDRGHADAAHARSLIPPARLRPSRVPAARAPARAAAPRSLPAGSGPTRSGQRHDPPRHVHEHAQQAVELALVRLLDDEPALDAAEELRVDLLGHRVEQLRHQQLHVDALLARERHRLARHARRRCPRRRRASGACGSPSIRNRSRRRFSGSSLREPLVVHARVHLAARGGRAALVVLDARGQVVAARHPGVADRADARLGGLEALVVARARPRVGPSPLHAPGTRACRSGPRSPCAVRSPGRRAGSPASGTARRC